MSLAPFHLDSQSGAARAGWLTTGHARVPTPAFMPVATQATVKALDPSEVRETGANMVIMNTYHLWLRPGPEVVQQLGGLHEMARFSGAIATDSGGFQAFSLAERTKLTEEGFRFSSHLDGANLLLSPEEAMRIQGMLGSDVAMQLDVCPSGQAERSEVIAAMERTTRWGHRCLEARRLDDHGTPTQALFGIIQGGTHADLRRRHVEELSALAFDGMALGGFSVGEPSSDMHRTLKEVVPAMDAGRIRYLMGVGTPLDLVRAIGCGIDLFDCVMPTRNARNGQVFVPGGRLVIRNARHRTCRSVLQEGCDCPACAGGYSRAYLRHLFMAGELLVHRLLSLHNLRFYGRLMQEAREAILADRYATWSAEVVRQLE